MRALTEAGSSHALWMRRLLGDIDIEQTIRKYQSKPGNEVTLEEEIICAYSPMR
jgi:hypothetical protein